MQNTLSQPKLDSVHRNGSNQIGTQYEYRRLVTLIPRIDVYQVLSNVNSLNMSHTLQKTSNFIPEKLINAPSKVLRRNSRLSEIKSRLGGLIITTVY